MADEVITNEVDNNTDSTTDYIDAIKQLKATTVDRAKYDELRSENKKLLESIVNGREIEMNTQQEQKASIEDLRKDWLNEDNNNLESVAKCLKLREALIAEGNPDPFLPIGKQIMPTNEDIEAANRVAQVLQECVDYAEGDSAIFTNELQRRMVDTKVR
jgi:hypothetical protein